MLAKKTTKNQITLPKKIAAQFPGVDYFEVSVEDNRIILEPMEAGRVDEVRRRLASLEISEKDIADAVKWARTAPK